jgi:hypothetical protein
VTFEHYRIAGEAIHIRCLSFVFPFYACCLDVIPGLE